jgi:hypothetical protein
MVDLYVVFDTITETVMSQPMTLIEIEVEIQKMIADPFNGVLIQPDEDGVYHGEYDGDNVALVPKLHVPSEAK